MLVVPAMLRPNREVASSARRLLAIAWSVLLVAGWLVYPPKVVPSPIEVARAWRVLVDKDLVSNLLSSLWLNFEAVAIATAISLGIAYLSVVPAAKPLAAIVSKLRFLGFTGLSFLFGLAVTGHALKVWLLVFGMAVFFATSMIAVVDAIPREDFDYARTLRMREWRVVWEVVVRGTFDQALEVLRQNAAMGWMMLTMVEGLVRSEGGVGALMLNENRHFALASVFALQLTILGAGIGQDWLLGAAKRALCPWAEARR